MNCCIFLNPLISSFFPDESTNLRTIQTAHPLMENASHFVYQLNCHMINANEGYLPLWPGATPLLAVT